MRFFKQRIVIPALLLIIYISGCAPYTSPIRSSRAQVGAPTPMHEELTSLPAPKEKIVVAVYKFRDQTGQYKRTPNGTSFSTAVTQGATSILIRGLEESGWFKPIEREGLSNLLNERKIIRSSRANYKGANGENLPPLPPLLYAGVILEGGIIAYDTNVMTGGFGARYFGVGGSGQYRQDRITIYLRATSTKTGQILKTVYTSKTILSQMVDIGVYRFVNLKRLLEVETGFSYNEPPELCVTEAIEKAVQALVIEGVSEGLWQLENPEDMESAAIQKYFLEKEQVATVDEYRHQMKDRRSSVGLGVNMAFHQYAGDYGNAGTHPAFEIQPIIRATSHFSAALRFGRGMVSSHNRFESVMSMVDLKGLFYFFPYYQFTPYMSVGGGIMNVRVEDRFGNRVAISQEWLPTFSAGLGFEYFFGDRLALNAVGDYQYVFSDELDGMDSGNLNDYFWGFKFGFNFYF